MEGTSLRDRPNLLRLIFMCCTYAALCGFCAPPQRFHVIAVWPTQTNKKHRRAESGARSLPCPVASSRPELLEAIVNQQDALPDSRGSYMPAMCVRCDAPRKVNPAVPTLFAQSVDDIFYVCPSCGIKTRDRVRSS